MAAQAPDHSVELKCVENGIWTPIPRPAPAGQLRLKLKDVDPAESSGIKQSGTMTFHAVGCSGDFKDQAPGTNVANAMAAQVANAYSHGGDAIARPASFLLHLGDVVYKQDPLDTQEGENQADMYDTQFYKQYTSYARKIFALAGNHDGKSKKKQQHSAIDHFLLNFCDEKRQRSPDNATDSRMAICQPYPYWVLETPVAYTICLYTNDLNGGQFDDPMSEGHPQYEWLVETLTRVKESNNGKTVFLALHYPPYSGARNFVERGDPNLGPTARPPARRLEPIGTILQRAFQESGQYPDLVLSAHAHLYQRITYSHRDGRQIPYMIVGCGGHGPIENLSETCSGASTDHPIVPFDVIKPPGLEFAGGDVASVVKYNDADFGFLRVTVDFGKTVHGEFFAVQDSTTLFDSFIVDLQKHSVS
jgi:acid phosphatase type 7